MLILGIILIGMLAGAAAQLVTGETRHHRIDWGLAIIVGLIGSFVGGLLSSLISGDGIKLRPSGIIGSIVGAIIVMLVYKLVRGKPSAAPAPKSQRKRARK